MEEAIPASSMVIDATAVPIEDGFSDAHQEVDPVGGEVIIFREGASKAEMVRQLAERIPRNEFGLPIFFVRSDMLPTAHVTEEDIDAASVGLFYHEGFPTLSNGAAFWNQLPHEPREHFEIFQKYLDQAGEIGIRQIDILSASVRKTPDELSSLLHEYFWSARSRAYDTFIVAAEAKRREHIIRKMENSHFDKASALMDKLNERFEGEFEDWIEELNAKEAIEVMMDLAKLQRMSVGLTGQHASSTDRASTPGTSAEVIIRRLTQTGGMTGGQSDRFQSHLEGLLSDPENGMLLQEAIIKVTAPNNSQAFRDV
jgi:hypothetical protein